MTAAFPSADSSSYMLVVGLLLVFAASFDGTGVWLVALLVLM
jgi:hypothetical protein